MAYNFTKSDGTAVSIPDNTVVSNQFSIDIIGRNASGYGLYVARDLVRLTENFSNTTAPPYPTKGQFWHDQTSGLMKFYNGASWLQILAAPVSANFVLTQDLVPNINCSGMTGIDLGSPSLQFCNVYANTFDGVATQARYADLAERYEADAVYDVGTVVKLGGSKEVTVTSANDIDVFGVISTRYAFLMNSGAGEQETHPAVGLIGRLPIKVIGTVAKFDRLVPSSIPGVACSARHSDGSAIIGRAMEDKDTDDVGLIECSLGAK